MLVLNTKKIEKKVHSIGGLRFGKDLARLFSNPYAEPIGWFELLLAVTMSKNT